MKSHPKALLPWYAALSASAILAAATFLGMPIPRAVSGYSANELASTVVQIMCYSLLVAGMAFLLAQAHLERRNIVGYQRDSSFLILFSAALAVVLVVAHGAFFAIAQSGLGYIVYEWPGTHHGDSWDRRNQAATVIRLLAPAFTALCVFGAWRLSTGFFSGKVIRDGVPRLYLTRRALAFTCVVTSTMLLIESMWPLMTPTRFIFIREIPLIPVYQALAVLGGVALPTFILARYMASRSQSGTRPARILAFGMGAAAAIQVVHSALMFVAWKPIITAMIAAGRLNDYFDFHDNYPLSVFAIAHTIQFPLILIVIWVMSRLALNGKPYTRGSQLQVMP
ncbi:hypothetical protein ACV4V9_24065 [Pseudomonas aeruginosa]